MRRNHLYTNLGVDPGRGFLVDLNAINAVMIENIDHTTINLVQPYFIHIPIGIIHIPISVAFWYDLKYLCLHWTNNICATTKVTIKMRTISACMAS